MRKITAGEYKYLLPMNEKYGKWLADKITAMRIYQPFSHLFEELYYHIYLRDGKWQIISDKYEESLEAILELIKKRPVTLTDSTTPERFKISFDDLSYRLDGKCITLDAANLVIFKKNMINDNWQTDVNMLAEFTEKEHLVDDEILRIYMLNTKGNNPKIGDIFLVSNGLSRWEKVTRSKTSIDFKRVEEELVKLCLYTPQLEFFAVDIILTASSFKIIQMHANPAFPDCEDGFGEEVNGYLHAHLQDMKTHPSEEEKTTDSKGVELISHYPKGYYPFLESMVALEHIPDFLGSLSKESWVCERGFLPYRLGQYGIDWSNHMGFISDFEYEYLGHVNNKYRVWFEDKVTIKYILRDFGECLPAYYYLIALKNGKNRVIPLMDCPEGFQMSYDDIFRLVREKGILALKPDEGTHGAGFFKFSYVDEKYYLNEKEATEETVLALLCDVNNQYLVTEFIEQHPDTGRVYSGSVNTARLTVFKKDGKTAQIGNGYVRFGTSNTGGVDNIGAGGIGADLDVSTGYYGNAVKLGASGKIEFCPIHPDSGASIEGYLPNWDDVVKKVLRIANSMPEIEYMGFDVAFTEGGIKLPEINRFPDFPKINKLTPTTMDYLLYKLEQKKRAYGYMHWISK